jgi:diguanylate cyclase (GGDEF)-like protein
LTLPDGGPPIAKARVLIVDDSREIREGVRALLATEPSMLVVGEASNGDEALGIALVLRPDLIVLDHEMPGTRGLDLLPKLRVILPGVRVVMFTMSSGISSQALRRGADAVAAKDDPAGLLGALRRSAATRAESRVPEQPRRTLALGRGWWRRALLVSALALLYVVSFIPLVGWIGGPAIDLAILVVVASGATFGLWGGLAAALLVLPVNAVLIRLAGVSVPEAGSPTHVLIAIAIGAAFGRLRDVSARADAQSRSLAETGAALEASDQRLVGLVEDAPVLLVSIDLGGVIVDALGSGFGDHPKFSPERMRGQQAAVFYADNPGLLARLSRALSGEDFTERVESYGFVYDVHLRPRHDRAGAVDGATVVLVNVSGRVRAEQRLERAAFHDPLTGLPNRILLQDRLHQALRAAGRTRGGVAVLVLGLDSFRSVNNTYGHSVGDVLLHEIGERLRGTIRAVDTLARFSGDEFAIVLADCPPGGDVAVVAKVREALVAPFVVAERQLDVSVSVGSACHPEDGDDPQTLMRKAEVAMFAAKRSRAGHEPYRAALDTHGAGRMMLMTELRGALESGALALHFQPVVAVSAGQVVMAEALIRWDHPERGQIPPLEFIPLAEETDLMRPLTDWVLAQAVGQCRRLLDAGWRVPIAVNLSVRNLVDDGLAARIGALLEAASVPASSLTVEITESVVMADAARSLETMRELRQVGIEIAIDDFGTGYSSLAYLGRLPISSVKIDRTFVGSMLSDHSSLAIVTATIGLAHALGLKVVGEGVESEAVLDRLRALGSDRAQGYHIARPMPADAFVAWLEAQSPRDG